MRKVAIALSFVAGVALAAPLGTAQAANGPWVTRTAVDGTKMKVQLTGKYSDCIRGSQRLGHPLDSATRFCNSRPGLRR
jgi:hypothetical protein